MRDEWVLAVTTDWRLFLINTNTLSKRYCLLYRISLFQSNIFICFPLILRWKTLSGCWTSPFLPQSNCLLVLGAVVCQSLSYLNEARFLLLITGCLFRTCLSAVLSTLAGHWQRPHLHSVRTMTTPRLLIEGKCWTLNKICPSFCLSVQHSGHPF